MLKHLVIFAAVVLSVLPASLAYSGQTGGDNCKSSEFWYSPKACCLPHGGPPEYAPPPPPPRGNECPPAGYYWGTKQGCCVPNHPPPSNNPPPQCPPGWVWQPSMHVCVPSGPPPHPPPPQPSGGYGGYGGQPGHGWKRHQKARSSPLCPTGLDACPISGLTSDYECLDTSSELESCGGCVSAGAGQDCTTIKGAWNVGCERGRCKVYTCFTGYLLSADSTSCVPVS